MRYIECSMSGISKDKAKAECELECSLFLSILAQPHQTSSYVPDYFPSSKSRTVGRTRCDCFHTQEVITPDLPQLWLRLINIDKQLMRCQAGTRPFPSCLPMTPMERKNDLDLAMSPSFISVQRNSLIIFSWRARLTTVQLGYSDLAETVASRSIGG